MKRIKDFFKKHSTEIIAVLVAISGIISNYADIGGKTGSACSLIVTILGFLTATVKVITYYSINGIDEQLIKMAVALVKMLSDNQDDSATKLSAGKESENDIHNTETKLPVQYMTDEQIELKLRQLMEK